MSSKSSIHLAPAKLNIRLKVVGRRPDGYHELVSVMVPVGLYDRIELQMTAGRNVEITCSGISVPTDEENLAYRAAKAFLSHAGLDHGVSLRLTKNIPVAAGLGGGSSDAACVLSALNRLCSFPLSPADMEKEALRLGADVPFFLNATPSIARGIGEILEPIEAWPRLWYVIIMAPIRVSTSWVYGKFAGLSSREQGLELTTDEYHFIMTNLQRKPLRFDHFLENDLERVTASLFPVINSIKKSLVDAGAEGALMSGSGPGVFGVFGSKDRALDAKRHLMSKNLGDIYVVEGVDGVSSSGKTRAFGARIRRFESSHPSQCG